MSRLIANHKRPRRALLRKSSIERHTSLLALGGQHEHCHSSSRRVVTMPSSFPLYHRKMAESVLLLQVSHLRDWTV